jgi:hypothetical protein
VPGDAGFDQGAREIGERAQAPCLDFACAQLLGCAQLAA